MELPGAEDCIVEVAKVTGYLLNPDHRTGGAKADFFRAFGFMGADPGALTAALRRHAQDNAIESMRTGAFGTSYVVSCRLRTPDGRNPCIRTVWIIEPGLPPRLVTAYPG